MEKIIRESLWGQFGASIDMLENAIRFCPKAYWDDEHRFWYNAYHCLFFLDYYLTMDASAFVPPAPFDLSEFEDRMPERTYTKQELLDYVDYNRKRCRALIMGLDEKQMTSRWRNVSGSMDYPVVEILMYNMRHVQHHAAQLNLLLRQMVDDAPEWVSTSVVV